MCPIKWFIHLFNPFQTKPPWFIAVKSWRGWPTITTAKVILEPINLGLCRSLAQWSLTLLTELILCWLIKIECIYQVIYCSLCSSSLVVLFFRFASLRLKYKIDLLTFKVAHQGSSMVYILIETHRVSLCSMVFIRPFTSAFDLTIFFDKSYPKWLCVSILTQSLISNS